MGSGAAIPKDPKQVAKEKFEADFKDALNLGFWEQAGIMASHPFDANARASKAISLRTPEQTMDAFEKARRDWKPVLDEIRKDPTLLKSVHNVLSKDPTMIETFGDMFADMGNVNPQDFANTLKDPRTRKALGKAMDKIAEKDNLTGKDFRELYDNRNDQNKTMAKLKSMGVGMQDMMSIDDALSMFTNFLRNPVAFLQNLPDMLVSMGVMGPIQADTLKNSSLYKGVQGYMGVVLGPITGDPKGYGGHIADLVDKTRGYIGSGQAERDIDNISGQADEKAAQRQNPAGTRTSSLQGDTGNVQAAANLTQQFDLARYGITPNATPAQQQQVAAYDAETLRRNGAQQNTPAPAMA